MSTATAESYPLAWPTGWPRRAPHERKSSDYRVEFARARDELAREVRLLHGRDVVISSNVPVRRDGLPLAGMRAPDDPGVAVYWTDRKGRPRVIACDVWRTVRENLRAVGLAVEAIRTLERTGSSEILDRAFEGFKRLPAPSSDHWRVLGIPRGSTRAALDARLRELAREYHPDRPGGNAELMAAINAAYSKALGEVRS